MAELPPIEGAVGGAALRRKRGRPASGGPKAPRKSRATVPRLTPCYVDMGGLTLQHSVRYDVGQQRYDLQDLFDLAYNSRRGYATSRRLRILRKRGLFKQGHTDSDHGLVKWLGDPDTNLNKDPRAGDGDGGSCRQAPA